jgi:hypothetical protein
MVTGQDAEPAAVLGQRGRDAVLGREVGDGGRQLARLAGLLTGTEAAAASRRRKS